MPSFDIVSEVDRHEITNAVDQSNREITNRYDFKGSDARVELGEEQILLEGNSEFQLDQMRDILYQKLAKRGIDVQSIEEQKPDTRGQRSHQALTIRQGIDKELARRLVKMIKDSKIKVQASVQGEQVRVSGKKRDDLQQTIALLKQADVGLPLQFTNFRD